MKDIGKILRSLGLNESEIKTYLAALKQGASTVVEITKHTHLSRQAIYLAIESMTERGLMSSVMRGKKRLFTAEPPDKLLAYAKRKEAEMREEIADLEKSLPELELQLGGERPIVRMYEGKEGIRAFLEEVKKVKPKFIHEIADADAIRKAMSADDLAPYRREVSKHKAHVKGIYTGTVNPNPNVDAERVVLDHPKERFQANISVLGDRVGFVSLEGKMYTIILENKAVAKAVEHLIDLAYEEAKRKGKQV
jgi:sugar-specific transcriptional regulator TrmB